MNVNELETASINCALAYTVGLMYPLIKIKELGGKNYILGSVNHNSNKITDEELAEHYDSVRALLEMYENTRNLQVVSNKSAKCIVQPKEGFTILLECGNCSEKECKEILTQIVKQIAKASNDIKKEFVKGCFDGRSSWDTTAHYLALDVDRDYDQQGLIESIVTSLGIKLNINNRGSNHSKNDQMRIKPESLRKYLNQIGFYSVRRKSDVTIGLLSI